MTAIPVTDASGYSGATLTFQNSTASDTLVGGQSVHLVLNNTSGTNRQVTITTPEVVEGALAVADRVISGLATGAIHIIPVPARYNDPATGLATVVVDTPGATAAVAAFRGSARA